jgi:hypothetical protein
VAIGLVALGRLFTGGGPIIPISPITTVTAEEITTSTITGTTLSTGVVTVREADSFDPFGEGGENDQDMPNVIDGDTSTLWRSERYHDPLSLQKPGVGVSLAVDGTPSTIQLVGLTPGTEFELRWASEPLDDPAEWDRVIAATAPPGTATFSLAERTDGYWLLWMTDLPEQPDGTYYVELAEVRFLP